jgi:uncharacterized protein GlcG (DUF336 family)
MSALSRLTQASTIAAFALSASLAQAQSYGSDITVDIAKKVAAGAVAECAKNNWRVAVAVVDAHGDLVYFERIDDTQHASLDIAIKKANVAARFRRSTRAFVDAIAKAGPSVMTLPGMIASPGGLPIVSGGKIIGAVGVSGVTGDQDEQCAKAGISSL